jgi:two-component system, sporulation sensor kinase B
MSIIKDFLLQLTLLIIPIFIYFTFILERVKKDRNITVIITILWGISILLCMSFPVNFGEGARLDIRFIPLLLGTLYLGFWPGILLSLLIILYRLSFGLSPGFYNTVLVIMFSLPVILYFQKSFIRSKKDKRTCIAVGLSVYYCVLGLTLFGILKGFSFGNLEVQLLHLTFMAAVTLFCIVLIEKIKEIHQLRQDIQNSEKLRVISELTGVFVHEIRNPMQVARGFLQLLDDPDLPHKKKEYINVSIEELDRANEIIDDFLAFGKPSENLNGKVNAGDQVERVANLLQSFSLNNQVEIKMDIMDGCWIDANPQKINQSLINIMKNAVESMPNGGIIWVACSPDSDGFIRISIKDQGVGMTKQQIDRLGNPYYSLKEKGTGLGMMVSFQIIRSYKGKVIVNSKKGEGTEFIILLPQAMH